MIPKSIESTGASVQRLTTERSHAVTPATITTQPTDYTGYNLRRFLTACPDEDANVIFARSAVREGYITSGFVQAPSESLVNGTSGCPALQSKQPYVSAIWACQQALERAYVFNLNSVGVQPQTSRFQIAGTTIGGPISAATHAHTFLPEDLEEDSDLSLRVPPAADPVDDANALYGRAALGEIPSKYCPLTQILKETEAAGFDEKVGHEKVCCEEEDEC